MIQPALRMRQAMLILGFSNATGSHSGDSEALVKLIVGRDAD